MRILCCLDGTNNTQLSQAAHMLTSAEPPMYGLIYVIDVEPRKDIARARERFLRHPSGPLGPRAQQIQQVEQVSAQDILNEGLGAFPGAELLQRQGRPEREIVNCAAAWQADLILLTPRTIYLQYPQTGRRRTLIEVARHRGENTPDIHQSQEKMLHSEQPALGPKSVGHVARFVLDHAPCPVLLVRPLTRERFPLTR